MTTVFTHNDLIRYIYRETSKRENQVIEILLETDYDFFQSYQDLLQTHEELDHAKSSPSEQSIQNILNFSKTFHYHSV